MVLQTTQESRSDHLAFEIKGAWDEDEIALTLADISERADELGQTRLLIDVCELGPANSFMTRFFTGQHIARVLGQPFRVAVVSRRELYDGLAETVAVNRGASMKVFFDRNDAVDWLRVSLEEESRDRR